MEWKTENFPPQHDAGNKRSVNPGELANSAGQKVSSAGQKVAVVTRRGKNLLGFSAGLVKAKFCTKSVIFKRKVSTPLMISFANILCLTFS